MFLQAIYRPVILALVCGSGLFLPLQAEQDPPEHLAEQLLEIDQAMPGNIGVYVRHVGEGWSLGHAVDRDWYLASTIKIPLGIVLMQLAEEDEWSLDDELVLTEGDFVDGSGSLLWEVPGSAFSLAELNRRSIRDSDSTATDMLIRFIGEERLNARVAELTGGAGLGPITTILQVRQDAWSMVHPDARELGNLDFIELSSERDAARRHGLVLERLGRSPEEADAATTREAFTRYYRSGRNSGSLVAFGQMLEALLLGHLLDADHTRDLIRIMESVSTGDRRIKAGLPQSVSFAHKTGTQIDRACNVGILEAGRVNQAVILMMCAEDYEELAQAEQAFAAVGRVVSKAAGF